MYKLASILSLTLVIVLETVSVQAQQPAQPAQQQAQAGLGGILAVSQPQAAPSNESSEEQSGGKKKITFNL